MIKMNTSAPGLDGDMVTETLWFHMNKVDLIELQQSSRAVSRTHFRRSCPAFRRTEFMKDKSAV